jgi:lycopene cyclase CruP
MDTNPKHIGLTALFDNYFRLLPEYHGVELMQLSFQRALFGFFPGYRKSPLQTPWQRILPFGDSSGSQSPLSFGGFGNMLRHLKRLTLGIQEALDTDQLSVKALNLLQPYQPNLSVNWLFQKAMSVGIEQEIPDDRINNLLSVLFETMQNLGELVIKPFLKDVVQFSGLTKTLLQTSFSHPLLVIQLIPQLGLFSLLDWIVHYFNLGAYAVLFSISPTLELLLKGLPSSYLYYWHRWVDAWEYGSGRDYLK